MPAKRRFSAVAIALHWLIALAVIANIIGGLTLGWFLGNSDSALKAQGQINHGLHKSLGLFDVPHLPIAGSQRGLFGDGRELLA